MTELILMLGEVNIKEPLQALDLKAKSASITPSGGDSHGSLEPWSDEVKAAAALQVAWRDVASRRTLIAPVTTSNAASLVAARTARVLAVMRQAPILFVDLYTEGDRAHAISEELDEMPGIVLCDFSSGESSFMTPSPSGPKVVIAALSQERDPLGFVSSDRFRSFLKESANWFNTTLVNGPSPLDSAASLLAAQHCDGCVLLVEEGVTRLDHLEQVRKLMAQAGCRILGFLYLQGGRRRPGKGNG